MTETDGVKLLINVKRMLKRETGRGREKLTSKSKICNIVNIMITRHIELIGAKNKYIMSEYNVRIYARYYFFLDKSLRGSTRV